MAHLPKAAVLAIGTFKPTDSEKLTTLKDNELVPELGKEAALVAMKEWGPPEPQSKITHLIFHSNSGVHVPGADCQITKLLGLRLDVKRTMLYQQGSYVGGTLLRMAKDTAENNPDARILVVCSEITLISRGVAALIVGKLSTKPNEHETPLFELMSASETIVPGSDAAIKGTLSEMGLTFQNSEIVPRLISDHTDEFLRKLLGGSSGMAGDWNSFFWAIHAGDQAILDQTKATLKLDHGKLEATRHVLSEYGDIGSASVFFVLNEIKRRGGKKMEWGILFAFGAGLTLDAVLLRRFA